MKTKKLFFVFTTLAILGILLAFNACQKNDSYVSPPSFSDDEIVNGIMFLQGPFIDAVPELKEANRVVTATLKERIGAETFNLALSEQKTVLQSILATASALDPSFVSSFAGTR